MPTTALGFPYPSGSSPTNVPGDLQALADADNAYATAKVEPLWTEASDQKVLSAAASPTGTSNVSMSSLDMTFTSLGTSDVVWIDIAAEVLIPTAGAISIVEMLIDGSANTALLRTGNTTGVTNMRVSGYKRWRVTGLAAGSHTITFRTRNNAAATDSSVVNVNTVASYWKKA